MTVNKALNELKNKLIDVNRLLYKEIDKLYKQLDLIDDKDRWEQTMRLYEELKYKALKINVLIECLIYYKD